MGVTPNYLPGFVKTFEKEEIHRIAKHWNCSLEDVFKPVDIEEKLLRGKIKALLVFGEDPFIVSDNHKYFKGIEFLAVQDMFRTVTSAEADVVFPAASYIEQDGTYTACDRRVQRVNRIKKPKMGIENWKLIERLSNTFNKTPISNTFSEISNEIRDVNRFYQKNGKTNAPIKNPLEKGYFNEKGKPVFSIYEIDTATLNPELPTLLYSENYYKIKIKNQLVR
jgi:predicted molibdopterin-dependent oxidoreductase YjgC